MNKTSFLVRRGHVIQQFPQSRQKDLKKSEIGDAQMYRINCCITSNLPHFMPRFPVVPQDLLNNWFTSKETSANSTPVLFSIIHHGQEDKCL